MSPATDLYNPEINLVAGPVLGPIQCNFRAVSVDWFCFLKYKK